ncbi:type II toxin-antitoxin system VapB family antitoxin [Streptomyces sp. MAR4 CNX-425]|uniref:type II toxin-antitoxin system VapB family antitoxin n=1 Tax=Streptomyces sp. MAR4 CNX-425 TaxID=3406343 RepID=UPI003B5050C1
MTKILVDIDEDALAAAQHVLRTRTKKDTVNQALTEVVARINRAQARTDLARLAADGAMDLDLLLDKQNYRPGPGEKRDDVTPKRGGD